jgi:glucose/arabinose dehydrogenase
MPTTISKGRTIVAIAVAAALSLCTSAEAQLRARVYVSGLTNPLAFVQDPSDAAIQYIAQQGGLIRVVQNGSLLSTPFLNLTGSITSGGERGLLGLAFPADYATSGRFYVNFTNPVGHSVVARFKRSAANPRIADPGSRFDLLWSTGERFIRQPYSNHNGGHLAFGPDGYLYVGMGDGGSGNDPEHRAQNRSELLGKMLRIDVNVPESDAKGFAIPASNPWAGGGAAPEIWAFGLRNPWRYSFDDPLRGGTGALLIADVGQGAWEEIDYEPAGRGGRNYGWRNREGAHNNVTSLPPAFLPLVDPIYEYSHSQGASVTGGFVYRGTALGAPHRGRYFFADFVRGRVWSIALSVNTGGEAAASGLAEHTAELSATASLGSISSFGVDAAGELYLVSFNGTVLRITSDTPQPIPAPKMQIDTPADGARARTPFTIAGWSLDATAQSDSGIEAVHLYAYPSTGGAPLFLGVATRAARPDVAAAFGAQFANAGFALTVANLAPGGYRLVAFGLVAATRTFDAVGQVAMTVEPGGVMAIDTPSPQATVSVPFDVGGWAIDRSAASGTGIDVVHIYAYPVSPAAGPPIFLGVPAFGSRPDVAAAFGAQFSGAGFNLTVTSLATGIWDLVVYARSTVSGAFDTASVVRVAVR